MTVFPKLLKIIIAIVTALYVTLCATVYFYQEKMIYHPVNIDFGDNAETLAMRFKAQKVNYNGTEIRFFLHENKSAVGTTLYLHGNGGSASHSVKQIENLLSLPLNVIVLEYPGYSNHPALPSELSMSRHSFSAYDWIKERYPKLPLFIFGRSLGTGPATRLAASRKPDGLILIHPYTSVLELSSSRYPFLPTSLLLKHTYRSGLFAKDVTAPVIAFQGGQDKVIPHPFIYKQLRNFRNRPQFTFYPNRRHNDIYEDNADLWNSVFNFIKKIVAKTS